jgi:cohesin complex subunit SA-1/2
MGSLYTTDLITTIQQWVVSMSSSQLRSFRHTATVIALELETALCEVAASVEKEAEVVGRQREGEKKRKATNKGTGVREKELESKAQEIRERRSKLAEFIKEFVDGCVASLWHASQAHGRLLNLFLPVLQSLRPPLS